MSYESPELTEKEFQVIRARHDAEKREESRLYRGRSISLNGIAAVSIKHISMNSRSTRVRWRWTQIGRAGDKYGDIKRFEFNLVVPIKCA